ncbi:Glu-tRNA(Gln) amidotransferase subunit GatE [Candidatus Woesearchaeota archaeon]|nr:Glu-tRNA(Gln) amidotransferase subunit GatE [Candidatus Woesearchaeota archaeon]
MKRVLKNQIDYIIKLKMLDHKEFGLKIGLEIHRQMETHKLFCSCPSILTDNPGIKIMRRLIATKSELGEEDVVARYEMGKNRYVTYEYPEESSCLVEADDEPPHPVNKHALETALIVAKLLNCKITDEVHFMRKQVLDYSNTSGFQRSSLIGFDGYIETPKGKVSIQGVCLEEDAARKIKEEKDYVTYRLDRLGIPLIEVSTGPDIDDPDHAKEIAEYIGMVLKSTGRFKSGIGTIRQDVNLSIKGYPRVEVKGFQDLRSMPKVIRNEVERMLNDIKEGKKLQSHVRKVEPDSTTSYLRPMPGAARLYVESDIPAFRITEHLLNEVKIPELATERALKLEKEYGLSPQLAKEVLTRDVFFVLVDKFKKIEPNFIAKVIAEMPKELQSRYNLKLDKLKDEHFEDLFRKLERNEISRNSVLEILKEICEKGNVDYDKFKPVDENKIEKEIFEIIKKNKGASFNAVMGEIMKKFRGKIDNKKIVEIVKKEAR